ncbi:hypothetical protein BZG36_04355 [Bifiguratus adelaidae]|uniref:Transcription factor domain-containing protein n=1 Tax=Bifiguratus adelaidae TaxID=1938954 RepID=A0A261XWZ0_9FUNG|nr:hypothetical protein BZG36_04355 [Bifiguratus adelaidae]
MTVGYSGQTPATRSVPIPCSQYNEGDQRIYGGTNNAIDFTKVDLVCTVDSSRVRNRWLEAFLPSENQRPKNFPTCIVLLLSRVFKTYPRMMLRQGGLPPFIHPAQLAGQELPIPLANCFSIARMWDGQVRGSETLVREIIRREMNRLHTERRSYDQMTLLAASQAFLIYAIMLFFASDIGDSLVDRQTLINLLEFACDITSTGTMCPAEFSDTRPDWPSWIVASAKRRTLYTMYMLDNLFCSLNSLPYYIAEELESLPAPASKVLWEASRKDVWEKEYNIYLAEWIGGGLTIDELWPVSETGALERRKRVDKWLESVDEFGMMLYAVTLATHGV